jgi:tetratricopeptide (TPR) repeat protein
MKILLACLSITFVSVGFSQAYDPEKVNAKAQKTYDKALELLGDGQIKEAVPVLQRSISEDSNFVDAYLSLGGVMGQLKKYEQSVKLYEKARQKDSAYFRVYYLPYSINLAGLGKYEEALLAVNRFLQYPRLNERSIKSAQFRKRTYEFAINYALMHKDIQYNFSPVNLGDSVNTAASEYYPSVTVTDSLLVYTRKTTPGREDFIESAVDGKSFKKWKLINGDINIETNKGALSVSQDGEWLIFAGQLSTQSYKSFDIYISYYTPNGMERTTEHGRQYQYRFL